MKRSQSFWLLLAFVLATFSSHAVCAADTDTGGHRDCTDFFERLFRAATNFQCIQATIVSVDVAAGTTCYTVAPLAFNRFADALLPTSENAVVCSNVTSCCNNQNQPFTPNGARTFLQGSSIGRTGKVTFIESNGQTFTFQLSCQDGIATGRAGGRVYTFQFRVLPVTEPCRSNQIGAPCGLTEQPTEVTVATSATESTTEKETQQTQATEETKQTEQTRQTEETKQSTAPQTETTEQSQPSTTSGEKFPVDVNSTLVNTWVENAGVAPLLFSEISTTITNLGTRPLLNVVLRPDANFRPDRGLWGATRLPNGDVTLPVYVAQNGGIAPGASYSFGFINNATDTSIFPPTFTVIDATFA